MGLKLFSDRSYLPADAPHAEILYPWWGPCPEKAFWSADRRFDRYVEEGRRYFELVDDPRAADAAVLPADFIYYRTQDQLARARAFAREMHDFGKPVLVFLRSDSDEPVAVANTVVFRTSMYRSHHAANEFPLVAWTGDLVARHLGGRFTTRRKGPKPVVGFCGYAFGRGGRGQVPGLGLGDRIKRAAARALKPRRGRPALDHVAFRTRILGAIWREPAIQTNFLLRSGWYGGHEVRGDGRDASRVAQARTEYVDNLVNSDYGVCMRGAGNYSFRIYEVLCCGRIPVFVDTDCRLPYDFLIDWKQLCVWVDAGDWRRIPERILHFHETHSERDLVDLQTECRRVWQQWLSVEGFFGNLHRHLQPVSTARVSEVSAAVS